MAAFPPSRHGEPPAIFLIRHETNGRPRGVRVHVSHTLRKYLHASRATFRSHAVKSYSHGRADRRLPPPLRDQMSPLRDSQCLFLAYPTLLSGLSLFSLLLRSIFIDFFPSSVFSVVLRCFGIIIVSHGRSTRAPGAFVPRGSAETIRRE